MADGPGMIDAKFALVVKVKGAFIFIQEVGAQHRVELHKFDIIFATHHNGSHIAD